MSEAESDAGGIARARCLPNSALNVVVERRHSGRAVYPGTDAEWWECQVTVRYTCSH